MFGTSLLGFALGSMLLPNLEWRYDVWYAPKGSALKKYSSAADRETAEKVAKELRRLGQAEVVGPLPTFRNPGGSGGSGGSGGGGPGGGGGGGGTGTEAESDFIVPRGQLTFDAEGTEGGPYHSRTPHVPTNSSGLTLGRGYDMKEKTAAKIKSDLIAAGLSEADAALYSKAAGLKGDAARKFIKDNKLAEITPKQQKKLFLMTYDEMEADVRRICNKADVIEKYGKTDWDKLHPAIKDLLVDLRYRGDYTPASRVLIQKLVVANDLAGLAKVMADADNWPGVPTDRFNRRRNFANRAAGSKNLP